MSETPVEELVANGVPPMPPVELRRLVCHDDTLFEPPQVGTRVFPEVESAQYRAVFDFGCGCGRIARQLMSQQPRPEEYVGIDIHKGMIRWCQENLSKFDPAFQFHHHDVWNLGLGPDNTKQSTAPFPAPSGHFSLVVAHSVFTHVYKEQTEYYVAEIARILADDGIARTTWFLFDRSSFPMLFDFQVCLFVNEIDPTNAVIYDWRWTLDLFTRNGLRVVATKAPFVKGHQWEIFLRKSNGEAHEFSVEAEALGVMSGASDLVVPEKAVSASMATPATHLLHYTGALDAEGFRARCSEIPFWYHSYYFDNGFAIRGDYDIGADVAKYGFPESMAGMSVLDIGTGAGWFAHYFEQLGAEVFTVDARGYEDFDVYGRAGYVPFETTGRTPDLLDENGNPIYFSPVSRGFWVMKDILQSRVQFRNSRVYDVNPGLFGGRKFDLVFLGAILCHLRDPIGALMAARSVCKHRVIASTPVVLGEPESETMPRQYLPYTNTDKISWWLPNEACFKHWFTAAGFIGVDISRHANLKCDVLRQENGTSYNGDQILRVGTAFVP